MGVPRTGLHEPHTHALCAFTHAYTPVHTCVPVAIRHRRICEDTEMCDDISQTMPQGCVVKGKGGCGTSLFAYYLHSKLCERRVFVLGHARHLTGNQSDTMQTMPIASDNIKCVDVHRYIQ